MRSWYLTIIAGLLNSSALAWQAEEPASEAPAAQPVEATGAEPEIIEPMHVLPVSVLDERRTVRPNWETSPKWKTGSRFQIILHLVGDRLKTLTRMGPPIVDALIDDKGRELWDPTQYTIGQRTKTTSVQLLPMYGNQGWYPLQLDFPGIPRDTERIALLRGYINLVFGEGEFPIYIQNLTSWFGRELEHPDLQRLGIRIRLHAPVDTPAQRVGDQTAFAVEYIEGEQYIRNITCYDSWLRNMAPKFVKGKGELNGHPYEVYTPQRGQFDSDTELCLYVFTLVEEVHQEWEFIDEIEVP